MTDKNKKPTAAATKTAAKPAAKPVAKTAAKGAVKGGKGAKRTKPRTLFNALYTKKVRIYGTGFGVQPKRDLTHFVKWPRYIRIQRQRRVLMRRLKVPPTINQFTRVFDKNNATQLFKLMDKYRPEEAAAKKARLLKAAKERAAAPKGAAPAKPEAKPLAVAHGIDLVTRLVEKKKAKLVVIAHDVDPIEVFSIIISSTLLSTFSNRLYFLLHNVVIWLPALCRRMDVPYCIVKSKSRLGKVVHMKKTSCVAITGVNQADAHDLSLLVESAKNMYNNNADHRKQWGGNTLSGPTRAIIAKRVKAANKEATAKSKMN
ncbi:60S ribosomal protein L7a [Heterostelium album PN500]|uniref:60S ribosomal protein L7a n=1 Tax=Heterostelium pallidum (strain ATCC 26659 / Pp 5 / PN500) TaxID=670386 RepID=D3BV19_HETP5|nr:60S ribosomal protein L7a [Heterostelium album PN500]EFA74957.1 60S ribosomal protein L7a [Heterostelium album PN500]|eukprot:XP_020427091.1 60S ribosomal protein L7a [Heterostelium album PN500]